MALPDIDWRQVIRFAATAAWGQPNLAISTGTHLRFGNHGSKVADLREGTWHDFEGEWRVGETPGGGCLDLIKLYLKTGDDAAAITWGRQQLGSGIVAPAPALQRQRPAVVPRIVKEYSYRGPDNREVHQVLKYDPKDFRQRRRPRASDPPEDIRGGWVWNINGCEAVLYRLPEVIKAVAAKKPIF